MKVPTAAYRRFPAAGPPRPRHDDPTRWEIAYAAFSVLVYLGVRFGLNTVAQDDGLPAADGMATVDQAVILLGGIVLVVRHPTLWLDGLRDVRPFLVILALAVASCLWSQSPDASLRRSLTLATLIMFATYAHAVLGTVLICRVQVAVTWIVALLSFAAAALVPSSGFDVGDYAGAVRGVFDQKNSLGDAMLVGTLALSYIVLRRRRLAWSDLASLLLALVTCRLAQATTSFVLCSLTAGTTLVVLLLLHGGVLAAFGLATAGLGVALALFVVVAVPIDVFDVLGKDSTLTGRAQIWAALRDPIADRELLGYGYSAFWQPDAHAANSVWAAVGWTAPSAHNGYLDTRLELGLLGLAALAALGIVTIGLAIAALRAGHGAVAGWAAILLLVTGLLNADESSLPRPDIHLLQWILVAAACSRAWRRSLRPGTSPQPTEVGTSGTCGAASTGSLPSRRGSSMISNPVAKGTKPQER